MKKSKLLAIFLVAAVIGLADVFREEIGNDRAKTELFTRRIIWQCMLKMVNH